MTLLEVIEELEKKLAAYRAVCISGEAMDTIRAAKIDTSKFRYMPINPINLQGGYVVYALSTGDAETLRDLAKQAVVQQVTNKLTR